MSESCVLQGTTAAACTATITAGLDGSTTSTVTETHLSGSDYHRFDVKITGGAEKTPSATGECKASAAATMHDVKMVAGLGAMLAMSLGAVIAL